MGSDGGGSIRVPAHFSGICGLKPTPGRIPATGHFPTSVGPFALLGVVGPMARTVADLKVLFEVMQGPDDGDPSAAPVPVRWPSDDDLKKLRIGYFEDDGRTPVTPETRAAVEPQLQALKRAGFAVEPFRPEGLEQARQLWWQFFGIAGGMLLGPMTKGQRGRPQPDSQAVFQLGCCRTVPHRPDCSRHLDQARRGAHARSLRRCANIRSCFVRSLRFLRSGTASAVGKSMARPCNISTPGATPNGSICWELQRSSFPSADRRKACRSECRSSPVHGRRNWCWRLQRTRSTTWSMASAGLELMSAKPSSNPGVDPNRDLYYFSLAKKRNLLPSISTGPIAQELTHVLCQKYRNARPLLPAHFPGCSLS